MNCGLRLKVKKMKIQQHKLSPFNFRLINIHGEVKK